MLSETAAGFVYPNEDALRPPASAPRRPAVREPDTAVPPRGAAAPSPRSAPAAEAPPHAADDARYAARSLVRQPGREQPQTDPGRHEAQK